LENDSKEIQITLIVGSLYEELNTLNLLLNSLGSNINYLKEVICVVSGVDTKEKFNKVSKLKKTIKINSEIIIKKNIIMPGEARNIGIRKSKYEYICLLDSHPLPDPNWLSNSITILKNRKLRAILGKTKYESLNEFEKCFIAATYGNNPSPSIPGTIIERNLFREIGFFIPNIRGGEDGEWIKRAKYFYPNLIESEVLPCKYIGLKGKSFIDLSLKWYLTLKNTVNPRFFNQRILYFLFFSITSLLIAFSWNDNVASWDKNSFYYLPHISKIMILFNFSIYFIYRMIILPIRKNVNIFRFNLIEFFKFFFISIILDLIKLIAFIKNKK